ncbi:MAG: DUF447 family protein [Candidatus Methanomethylicia archaeon]
MNLYFLDEKIIYEGILLTRNPDGSINAAAMGYMKIDDSHIMVKPYINTKTYRNLTETRRGVLCIIDDVKLITNIVLKRLDISGIVEIVSDFPEPIISGSKAALMLSVKDEKLNRKRAEIKCKVDNVLIRENPNPYSRVKPAIIEMLIYYTKIKSYMESNMINEALKLVDIVKHNFNIVRKTSFGTVYEDIAGNILNEVLKVIK